MTFQRLQQRVQRAEQLVQGRAAQTQAHVHTLRQAWRDGWTPGRIVVAGLVSGFLAGQARPLRAMQSTRWLSMVGSLSGLFARVQTAVQDILQQAGGHVAAGEPAQDRSTDTTAPSAASHRHHDIPVTAPHPAEAATEMSEQ